MYEDVIKRLASFGYNFDHATDDWLLKFLLGKVTETIKNECNIGEIPDGLHHIAVDMVCGEFLSAKKSGGQLDGLNTAEAIKQIKEGDTAITYAVSDGAATLDSLISFLINYGKVQFTAFRRFVW